MEREEKVAKAPVGGRFGEHCLAEEFVNSFPSRPRRNLLPLPLENFGDIQLPPSGPEIHILRPNKWRAKPNLVGDVESDHDRDGKVDGEKVLCARFLPNGPDGDPKLRDKDETVEQEAEPGADNAGLGSVSELVEGVILLFPSLTEADVSQTD